MSRNMIAAAIVLALLTGGVVGQITAVGSQGVAPRVISSERRLELARSFYDGMNTYLTTGDADFLDLLAPGFQDTGVLDSAPGSADSLIARLDDLRMSAPIPQFSIETLDDLGEMIQVRVSTGLPAELDVGGFVVSGHEAASAIEFLQLQGDAIVARWGQDDVIPRIELSLTDEIHLAMPTLLRVEVDFVTLDPGVEWRPEPSGASWVIVEHGLIALDDGSAVSVLARGEMESARQLSVRRIANRSSGTSSFWYVTMTSDASSQVLIAGDIAPKPAGVTIESRAWSNYIGLPALLTGLRIELSRIAVPPGTALEPSNEDVGHQLIVIDGLVSANIHTGQLLHVSASGAATNVRDQFEIESGTGVATLPGGSASYRVLGTDTANLLLVAISVVD